MPSPDAVRIKKNRSWGSGTRVSDEFSMPFFGYHASRGIRWIWQAPAARYSTLAALAWWFLTGSLVAALVLTAASLVGAFEWWVRSRRRAFGSSGWSRGAAFLELRQRFTIVRRWKLAGKAAGLTGPERNGPPKLRRLRGAGDGTFAAKVMPGRIGVTIDQMQKGADTLRQVIGCREVVVKETASGVAGISFHWTDAVGRLVTLSDLPPAKRAGHFAAGVVRDSSAATLEFKLSMLVAGITRQGKSNFAWGCLASLLRDGVPIALYVSDTKEVEFAKFEWLERQSGGLLELRGYARGIPETKKMLAEVEKSMGARQDWLREQHLEEITTPTLEHRLVVVLVDEALDHTELIKLGHAGPIGRIGRKGSASLHVMWLLAQDGTKEAMGAARDLVGQSVCFRVRTASAADVALGSGAVALGGEAHRIKKTGQAYAMSVSDSAPVFFRAPVVTSDQKGVIARGLVPPGMQPPGDAPQESATYIYRNADRKVIYVGRSVDPEERARQHSRKDFWYDLEVDESLTTWRWFPSIPDSVAQETMLIGVYEPKWNHQHNPSSYRRRVVNRIPGRKPVEVEVAA